MAEVTESITMKNVIEGIVIGVSSGLVVSVLVGLKHVIHNYCKKRKEIKRIRDIIKNFRERIYSAKSFEFKGAHYTAEEQRKASFDDMTRQLYNALDTGSPNLSYEKMQEIRTPLFLFSDIYPEVRPNIETYNSIFEDLEKIEWLKLPPRTE